MYKFPGNNEDIIGAVTNVENSTATSSVSIKVNWVTIEVTEKVKVRDMLIKAKEAGAIMGFIDEYVIERVEEEGEIQREEMITVKEQEEFIAVPTGRTDVANDCHSVIGRYL